jgi:hypothetical protein
MKRTTFLIAAVGASVLTLACAPRAPMTEVSADDFDLAPLVGNWTGEYGSHDSQSTGDITFVLRAGDVAAFGRIEMVAHESQNTSVTPYRPMVNGSLAIPASQLLRIHFVRKEGNRVVGLLDSYTDSRCACRVTTTFQGAFIDGRTIEGTYSTISDELAHVSAGGHWRVTKAKRL